MKKTKFKYLFLGFALIGMLSFSSYMSSDNDVFGQNSLEFVSSENIAFAEGSACCDESSWYINCWLDGVKWTAHILKPNG